MSAPSTAPEVRSWRIAALAAVLGILAALFLFQHSGSEPSWKGKPLSEWLRESCYFQNGRYHSDQTAALMDAMGGMGTNAIPALLRLLNTPDPPFANFLYRLRGRTLTTRFSEVSA